MEVVPYSIPGFLEANRRKDSSQSNLLFFIHKYRRKKQGRFGSKFRGH